MRIAWLVLALVALAGCGQTYRPAATPSDTSSQATVPPEADNAVLEVDVSAAGTTTVEVPLPHLDTCLQPAEWLAGHGTARNATAALRSIDRGQVVAVTTTAGGSWSVQINTTGRPTCETFRYDPWSIDPDVNETQVEVRATQGEVAHASVLVRWVRGGCGQATMYDGTPAAGWTTLDGRTIPAGSCTS